MENDPRLHEKNKDNIEEPTVSSTMEISLEVNNQGFQDDTTTIPRKKDRRKSVPIYKLFVFADTMDVFLMIAGTIGSILNGVALPLSTLFMGSLIDAFGNSSKDSVQDEVNKVCLKFVYLGIGAGIGSFFQISCWMYSGERQASRMRCLYLKAILRQDITFFDTETSTGEVIGTMSGDTTIIQEAMGEKVGTFVQFMATAIGGLVIGFTKGWKLSLVMISVLPGIMIVGAVMALVITKTSSKGQQAYAKAGNVVEQTVSAIRTVVSFSGEKEAISQYDVSLKPAYKATLTQGLASGLGLGAFSLIIFSTYALALWYGSKLIINEGYSGGQVITIAFSVLMGGLSLGQATPAINAFASGQAAAYKMFETFKRKPTIDPFNTEGTVLKDIQGDIELKDVHFRYPARPDVQIFSGFSLIIPRGTTTAIVGESGSGKSTVISLIERFYDPESGEVLIDSMDIKKFQLRWLRQKIGLVSQEPVLFATTIKENIAYGKDGATLEEIKAATELANAAKFIGKMPLGLETMVGEHGAQLSGGQKQRIAIARAILKDPRILLLDEATSALDAESEKVVQDALDRIMKNRTTVIVAHRLTTIRNADMIAVVQRGSIVEKGSHFQLIENPYGAYSQLVNLQEMHETKEEQETKDPYDIEITPDDAMSSGRKLSKGRSLRQLSSRRFSSMRSSSQHYVELENENVIDEDPRSSSIPSWISRQKSKRDVEDGKSNNSHEDVSLSRLAKLNKQEIPALIVGSFAALITGVAFPVFALMFSTIIGSFFKPPKDLSSDIHFWAPMLVVLGITQIFAAPLQNYSFSIAGGKLVERVRSLTFKRVVYQEIGWFDDTQNSSGAVVARLSTDAANVRSVVGDALSLLIQNITTITAGIVVGFTANWKLALLILALVPLFGLQGWVQVKIVKGFSADAKEKYEQASQVASEAVGSIRTVASFCAEEKVLALYISKCSGPLKSGTRKGVVSGLGLGFSNFVMFAAYALIFWVGGILVKNGETTFDKVFKVFFGIVIAAFGVAQSMGMAPDIGKVKNSVDSVFSLLDRQSKIDASDASGIKLESVKGLIELQHVSFKYPSRSDVEIFKDLNIVFPSGKTVALVGESGCGKSTVISLLQRFYDPDSGTILLDGIEIHKMQVKWLRMQMGLVGQEPILFNDTIRANIAYGKDGEVSEEQIIEAATASNAHKFISTLPQGYDTCVGERGTQLSGGQKQRIAIARAILKDPKILLLDEATSALDAESERLVQDALDRVKVNRTTIVVAHRLSTIKDADIIAVVKNGVIAESGKHDELLAINDGAYATLVRLHMAST